MSRTIDPRALATAALLVLAACDDGADSGHADEDPAEHACERVADDGIAIAASEDASAVEVIEISEDAWTVSLPDGAEGYLGARVEADGEALLFVDTADVIADLLLDGESQGLPTPAPNELCGEDIPEHFELDLSAGDWTVVFSPAAVDSVWLMLIAAEGHAHDH